MGAQVGAMLDVEDAGEILVSNSRSEGGMGRPAWKFVRAHNVPLTNPANGGRNENPSIFYFKECRDVVLINPQFASTNQPIDQTRRFADVIRFEECENCRIIGGHVGYLKPGPGDPSRGFKDIDELDRQSLPNRTDACSEIEKNRTLPPINRDARLIRVINSKYIVGENIPTLAIPPEGDIHIDSSSQYCCFEVWGQHGGANRVVKVGDCPTQDHTIWISPLNFVISEGASGWQTLSISRGFSGNTIRVQSTAPGDLKWIDLPLAIPAHLQIKKLTVCYQVSDPRSFISQIRLSEEKEPPSATVIHDDPTDLKSTAPVCYESTVSSLQPNGAITLSLRLNFGDASDCIDIGAIGVLIGS